MSFTVENKGRAVRLGTMYCLWETGEAVPHLGLGNRFKLGFAHACACVERSLCAQSALQNHVGEAHSPAASMKGACENAPVGVLLGNVALLLHFYLTAKMEDFIAK